MATEKVSTASVTSSKWAIANGPSREALFDALRIRKPNDMILFEYSDEQCERKSLPVCVTGISYGFRGSSRQEVWHIRARDFKEMVEIRFDVANRTGVATTMPAGTGLEQVGLGIIPVFRGPDREHLFDALRLPCSVEIITMTQENPCHHEELAVLGIDRMQNARSGAWIVRGHLRSVESDKFDRPVLLHYITYGSACAGAMRFLAADDPLAITA